MKETFYFKHDLNAAEDLELVRVIMKGGMAAYGIYWRVVEMLYAQNGSIPADFDLLAFKLRVSTEDIANVIRPPLFVIEGGRVSSDRVIRELEEREAAKHGGKDAIARRKRPDGSPWVKDRGLLGTYQDPSTRRGEERREDITTAGAVDFSKARIPYGPRRGMLVLNLPVDEAAFFLKDPRISKSFAAALKWRIALKEDERRGAGGGLLPASLKSFPTENP